MKVKLKGYKVDSNIAYKIIEKESCCDDMVNCPIIAISYENEVPEMSIVQIECVHSYEDSLTYETYYQINKCPFCGDNLSIEVIEIEDVSSQYNEISKQADKYYQKANCCDSKTAEAKNRQLGHELSNKLDWWLTSDQI